MIKKFSGLASKRRFHYTVFGILITLCVLTVSNVTTVHEPLMDKISTHYEYLASYGSGGVSRISSVEGDKKVIFPRNFHYSSVKDLRDYYKQSFGDYEKTGIVKYTGNQHALTADIVNMEYKPHQLDVYDTVKDLDSDLGQCGEIKKPMHVNITNYSKLEDGLVGMVHVLIDQLKNDGSIKELLGFFKKDLEKQKKPEVAAKHWFKFAGTSVWLEQYGVHMMISRTLYSASGNKKSPNLSLTYAQLFDENWQELKDVELVIPTTNPLDYDEKVYKNMKFPQFLPIPFYHDAKYQKKRFYGPEDPRIMLVKNSAGLEEPLVVYNAYHRKLDKQLSVSEEKMNITFNYYRSMFMSWPFQFQEGKVNIDGLANPKYDKNIYNKAVELRRANTDRLEVQKNWTPFISMKERGTGADKNIYFIYRWSNLEVLKCSLEKFTPYGESLCKFDYQRSPKLDKNTDVGPLRGGTEMVSLNSLLPASAAQLMSHPEQEIWIGFARAHIKGCGCGKDMYRPNLAVLSREGNTFKISQLSSFTSFDIPVEGWSNPDVQCAPKDPSALIPNGISSWVAKPYGSHKKRGIEDYLTLSLSVADASVHMIQIKNLLSSLVEQTNVMLYDKQTGYTNDIVDCSLKQSVDFCAKYGQEQKKLGKTLA